PEIPGRDRLLAGTDPAAALPPLVPSVAEAIHHVRAVRVELHAPPLGNRREPLDGPHQLHALVGGSRLRAGDGPLLTTVDDDRPPPPAPRIPRTSPVSVPHNIPLPTRCHWKPRVR